MLKSALLVTAGIVIGGAGIGVGASLHAAGAPVYFVYEATITDEAAYKAALPEADKNITANGGKRIAGGFNMAKLITGKGEPGNRYVILTFPDEAAFSKAQADGNKAWIEKHGNGARSIMVQGIE